MTFSEHAPFVHPCQVCGDFAYFGYGVSLIRGLRGHWYCAKHRPDVIINWRSRAIPLELTPEQRKEADEVGAQRQSNRRRVGAVNANALRSTPEEDLERHIRAAGCELAAHIYLRRTLVWHAYQEHANTDLPDIGETIDAKGTVLDLRKPRSLLGYDGKPGQPKLRKDWNYVLVYFEEFDRLKHWLVGWERGEVLARAKNLPGAREGGDCHHLKPEQLLDMRELLALVLKGDIK
jgi:hypothetical protein